MTKGEQRGLVFRFEERGRRGGEVEVEERVIIWCRVSYVSSER